MKKAPHDGYRKALFRIDEVMEILSMSRNTILNLLAEGKLTGHNDKPGKTGLRITVRSVNDYLKRYELLPEYFEDKCFESSVQERKVLSKGVE